MLLAAFLESSAFLGLIVPGESVVIFAGLLASRRCFEIGDCIWIISLGAILGDSVGYALGKKVGRAHFERHSRLLFLKAKHLAKTETYFREHGGETIFFGGFIGILRALAPFAAGMSGMPYRKFVFYNVAGGILWATAFVLLGYFFGESWCLVEKWSGRLGAFVLFPSLQSQV